MAARGRSSRADSASGQPVRRQANACLKCHQKKVKCDMDSVGQPCTGCSTLGTECQKRSRKPYPPRKDTSTASTSRSESPIYNPSGAEKLPTPPRSVPSDPLRTPIFNNNEPFNFSAGYADTSGAGSFSAANAVAPIASMAPPPVTTAGEDTAMSGTMPFFSGDQQGYGYVLDICNSERESHSTQHYLIPQAMADSMDHEDLAYAEAKGCFSIPQHAICEDLVQSYFSYVHPLLPIVDIADFLEHYSERSFQKVSLVLLWSMFSVAASFASDNTVSMTGCKSRQELKKQMYGRAKCLHETGYEQDKVTLIQSSLLLGFWYSDLQDRAQSWHWTGVAISMAQTIGLHRDPDSRHFNSAISTPRRRLWANIWWSCFFRDRWLSFGYGRPLRINVDDCDVPIPSLDCMLELTERSPTAWRRYAPSDLSQMASVWLGLLQLTVVLGEILTANYQPRKSPLDTANIDSLERRIGESLVDHQRPMSGELLLFYDSYARLHLEAAMIALYRPYASEPFTTRTMAPNAALSATANAKIRAAATRANATLDRIISADTLRFAGPMMVPLLVPAMTIHLLESKSNDMFTRQWSKNRLDLCLLVLKRLEDCYPAAALVHELFTNAKEKNTLPFGISRHGGSNAVSGIHTPGPTLATAGNPMTPWNGNGNMTDSRASISTSLPVSAQVWPSPGMNGSGYDLWNTTFSPEKLFFPLDEVTFWE